MTEISSGVMKCQSHFSKSAATTPKNNRSNDISSGTDTSMSSCHCRWSAYTPAWFTCAPMSQFASLMLRFCLPSVTSSKRQIGWHQIGLDLKKFNCFHSRHCDVWAYFYRIYTSMRSVVWFYESAEARKPMNLVFVCQYQLKIARTS